MASQTPARGVVSEEVPFDETGKVSIDIHRAFNGISPDDIVDQVSEKVTKKVMMEIRSAATEPPRQYLGMSASRWSEYAWKAALGIAATLFFWYQFVNKSLAEINDNLGKKATAADIVKISGSKIDDHESRGIHPSISASLKSTDNEVKKIRESQLRQEGIDKAQMRSLDAIERDLRRQRNPR